MPLAPPVWHQQLPSILTQYTKPSNAVDWYHIAKSQMNGFIEKSGQMNAHKAELLQLNRTQFPSLGIFASKKVGNWKK
jgi:hypothetical protein